MDAPDDRPTAPAATDTPEGGGPVARLRRRGRRGLGGAAGDPAAGAAPDDAGAASAASAASAERPAGATQDVAEAPTSVPEAAPTPRRRAASRRGPGGEPGEGRTDVPAPVEDAGVTGANADDGSDVSGSDDGGDGDGPDGEGVARSGASRRRGRRGGRGRRGRGGNGGGGGEADDAGPDDDTDGAEARGPGRDGDGPDAERDGGDGGGRSAGAGGTRRDRGRRRGPADAGAEVEDDERQLEDAIARGGTRVAARQGRGGGGGSGREGGRDGGRERGARRERPGGVSEEVRRAILEGPPRTMLVTKRSDRTQVAVLEDRTLVEHYVTREDDVTFVGNIYMGRVQNVLPGMEAAFIDIGKGRNGVLYAGEVLYDEFDLEEAESQRIEDVLKPGQKVLVQVTKDPMGSKGPRLTMRLSLAGRYLVLVPNSPLFGISRKLTDRERDRLRRVVKGAKPAEHGIIVRTAAEDVSDDQVVADVERLLAKWARVEAAAAQAKALTAVYEEPPLVVKVIRDNFGPGFERCIVDDEGLHAQVRDYLDEVAPELLDKVELYGAPTADARSIAAGAPSEGDTSTATPAERRRDLPPLFDVHDVQDQLRKAMSRKVWLPSGGYLIIESTEAMKVIDVNTGKFTGGPDTNLEEIVLKTNLEAADEIVRQLRLRDMGGMIVIDFIDMLLKSNQDQVVRRLKRELLRDRTKTRVSEVSRLGLVQMTRKNVSQGLVESFSHTCEACEGRGFITELG